MGAEKETEKSKSDRPSFSVRLQPYEKSLLAEVVQYLNALERGDAKRQVENVLVMALLAQARLYDESCSDEERRRCCIEACDALDKHASMLRQLGRRGGAGALSCGPICGRGDLAAKDGNAAGRRQGCGEQSR